MGTASPHALNSSQWLITSFSAIKIPNPFKREKPNRERFLDSGVTSFRRAAFWGRESSSMREPARFGKVGLSSAALVCLSLFLSVALLTGCGGGSVDSAAEPRLVQAVAASIDTLSVRVTAWGKTEASRSVELAFEVPGTVESLPYDEGDVASRGAVLGRLRQNRFKANLTHAKVTHDEAERNLTRMTSLSEEDVVSDEERERAETRLASAEAALRSAEEDLRGSAVTAPFDGLVARRHCI